MSLWVTEERRGFQRQTSALILQWSPLLHWSKRRHGDNQLIPTQLLSERTTSSLLTKPCTNLAVLCKYGKKKKIRKDSAKRDECLTNVEKRLLSTFAVVALLSLMIKKKNNNQDRHANFKQANRLIQELLLSYIVHVLVNHMYSVT